MSVTKRFSPKDRHSTEYFAFTFANELPDGVVIMSAVWTAEVINSRDDAYDDYPELMIDATPSVIDGAKVSNLITGGVNDVEYLLTCTATFDDGQIIPLSAKVWVEAANRDSGL